MALLTSALADDFIVEQGTTFRRTWTWFKDEAQTQPQDLTGFTARLQIRQLVTSAESLLSVTSTDAAPASRLVLGGNAGTVELVISDLDTSAFSFSEAVYDLEVVSTGGDVVRLAKGKITLDLEVTR